jgi:hypothetical protein
VFFLKCDDQIVKRFLITNIDNHFEGDLHGQQVGKYTLPIYEKTDIEVLI